MFIKTKNKQELVRKLEKRIGKNIVIHYNCENCDDEQVTYDNEVTEDMIESFKEKGYLMVMYECTNCGSMTKFLHWEYIQGLEEGF